MSKERRIFQEMYPASELAENPLFAVEAVGYLKHLKVTNPEQTEWIGKLISLLILTSTEKLINML